MPPCYRAAKLCLAEGVATAKQVHCPWAQEEVDPYCASPKVSWTLHPTLHPRNQRSGHNNNSHKSGHIFRLVAPSCHGSGNIYASRLDSSMCCMLPSCEAQSISRTYRHVKVSSLCRNRTRRACHRLEEPSRSSSKNSLSFFFATRHEGCRNAEVK